MALARGVVQLQPVSGLGMYLLQIIKSGLQPLVGQLWNSRTGVKILPLFIPGKALGPLPASVISAIIGTMQMRPCRDLKVGFLRDILQAVAFRPILDSEQFSQANNRARRKGQAEGLK